MLKFLGVHGMALYPFILLQKSEGKYQATLINHEKIHLRQQLELLVIFFYPIYGIEFLFRFFQYRNWQKAYLNISFEREAYAHDQNLNYLSKRPFWAFIKYL
jgi:hypothetical protein